VSCVLRYSVPDALAHTARELLAPFRATAAGSGGRLTLHCDVSDADFDQFERQLGDAVRYLAQHGPALSTLAAAGGAGELDFGVALYARQYLVSVRFPPSLAATAGRLGLSLVASVYAAAEGEGARDGAATGAS